MMECMISMIALYQKANIKHDFQTRSKWIMHIHFSGSKYKASEHE